MRLLTGASKSVEGGSGKSTLKVWIPWWIQGKIVQAAQNFMTLWTERHGIKTSISIFYAKLKRREYVSPYLT
jgi:hypothetical protein